MEPQQEADNICQGNNVEKMQFGGIGQGGFAKEDEMVGWDMMIVMGLGRITWDASILIEFVGTPNPTLVPGNQSCNPLEM
ncbi:Uncharacterized protein TCM_035194 [Theobroma cacao]|uniref:Uncharacterized protein n=1 Tax=Theobroma cacao TaxID=3641 RepID=A0A061FPD4_THECC|nr:Uncharacterized protein TCM_035194 [Theobroma cacao]